MTLCFTYSIYKIVNPHLFFPFFRTRTVRTVFPNVPTCSFPGTEVLELSLKFSRDRDRESTFPKTLNNSRRIYGRQHDPLNVEIRSVRKKRISKKEKII